MKLRVSLPPHLHSGNQTRIIMLDVLFALVPCTAAGIYLFGVRAALVLMVSVLSSIGFELIWQLALRRKVLVGDLSAAVTGLILGLNLPSSVPLWIPVVGSGFAIVIVKQLFGGLGQNVLNPALAARGFLLISWPARMARCFLPVAGFAGAVGAADAVSSATPLSGQPFPLLDLFLGNIPGSIGEVSKLAILIGLAYLLYARVIEWHIPVVFLAATALGAWALGGDALQSVLTGGVMFGAVFMATDYASSPMTRKAQCIYAALGGFIVALIRQFGAYPEGVTFAILIMNVATPLMDKLMPDRIYGR